MTLRKEKGPLGFNQRSYLLFTNDLA